ncbi:hypothetical protein EBU99_06450 [bacterium]|nr:hypothetical protein [bacterium]
MLRLVLLLVPFWIWPVAHGESENSNTQSKCSDLEAAMSALREKVSALDEEKNIVLQQRNRSMENLSRTSNDYRRIDFRREVLLAERKIRSIDENLNVLKDKEVEAERTRSACK